MGDRTYRIAGIYSTGQALGDTGAMLPLAWFQTYQRQPSQYTLLFVVITPGASVTAVQARIDRDFPQLVTVRTLQQFGRADRSLSLILAADRGATVLALVIGAIVVMSAMTMSFIERTREFGETLAWYGDTAYGPGNCAGTGQRVVIKPKPVQPAVPGGFTIDDFAIDEQAGTVTCPAGSPG